MHTCSKTLQILAILVLNSALLLGQHLPHIEAMMKDYKENQDRVAQNAPLIIEGYPIKSTFTSVLLDDDPYRAESRILFRVTHTFRGKLASDTVEICMYNGFPNTFLDAQHPTKDYFENDSLSFDDSQVLSFLEPLDTFWSMKVMIFSKISNVRPTIGKYPVIEAFDKKGNTACLLNSNGSIDGMFNTLTVGGTVKETFSDPNGTKLLYAKLKGYGNITLPEEVAVKKNEKIEPASVSVEYSKSLAAPSINISAVNQRFEVNNGFYLVFDLEAFATSSNGVIDPNFLDWLTIGLQYNTATFGTNINTAGGLILELGTGIPTANWATYEFANRTDISSNQVKFDLRRNSATSPLNRIAINATPKRIATVKMLVSTCYQAGAVSFLTGTNYIGTYKITANAAVSTTSFGYINTNFAQPQFRSTGCTTGVVRYAITDEFGNAKSAIIAGANDRLRLTNTDSINLPFGNRINMLIKFRNGSSPDNGDEAAKYQPLDDIDILYFSQGTVLIKFPSVVLSPYQRQPYTPCTGEIRVENSVTSNKWFGDRKLKVAFSITNDIFNRPGTPNYRATLPTYKVPRRLVNYNCQRGMRFKYHTSMRNIPATLRPQVDAAVASAVSAWSNYIQSNAGGVSGFPQPMQTNWTVDTAALPNNLVNSSFYADGYCLIRYAGLGLTVGQQYVSRPVLQYDNQNNPYSIATSSKIELNANNINVNNTVYAGFPLTSAPILGSGKKDFLHEVIHEIGHGLGLDHLVNEDVLAGPNYLQHDIMYYLSALSTPGGVTDFSIGANRSNLAARPLNTGTGALYNVNQSRRILWSSSPNNPQFDPNVFAPIPERSVAAFGVPNLGSTTAFISVNGGSTSISSITLNSSTPVTIDANPHPNDPINPTLAAMRGYTYKWQIRPSGTVAWRTIRARRGYFVEPSQFRLTIRASNGIAGQPLLCLNGDQLRCVIYSGCDSVLTNAVTINHANCVKGSIQVSAQNSGLCIHNLPNSNQFDVPYNSSNMTGQNIIAGLVFNNNYNTFVPISSIQQVQSNTGIISCRFPFNPSVNAPSFGAGIYTVVIMNAETYLFSTNTLTLNVEIPPVNSTCAYSQPNSSRTGGKSSNLTEDEVNPLGPSFWLYPNPSENILNIAIDDFEEGQPYFLQVVNLTGSVLAKILVREGNIQLQVDDWTSGLYKIGLYDGKKWVYKSFVKN